MAGLMEDPRLDTAEILRVATKMENELEKLDIFMHIAIVNILNQLVQHRGMQLDKRAGAKEEALAKQEAEARKGVTVPFMPHLKQ